jgi:hypothetical protein
LFRAFHLLLLLFYFGTSYTVSQERVRLLVSEVQHSTSRSTGAQVDSGCQHWSSSLPNFQRTKPSMICWTHCTPDQVLWLPPAISKERFVSHAFLIVSKVGTPIVPSRAPPAT